MNNNTLSFHPTFFLCGVELIQEARKKYRLASENWTYPTKYCLGTPNRDDYYAEVWSDGMDWQVNYWIIESGNGIDGSIRPLLSFDDHHDKFNPHDFSEMVYAMLTLGRDRVLKSDHGWRYHDSVWPYLKVNSIEKKNGWSIAECSFEHASQPRMEFKANAVFVK